ncbi:MAG: solute-binding protein [Acidimicrobiaceae bacterium]|nr:solute-binding protein [Acidimicrobiaceae bacterium]
MNQRRLRAILALVAVVSIPIIAFFALAASDDDPGRVLILAPSSLAVAQDELDSALAQLGIPAPEWVFAGSQAIVAQLIDGAPADLLLTANRATLDRANDAGVTGATEVAFTENHLVLAVAEGNPGNIAKLVDLANPSLLIGVCAADVPCGQLANKMTAALGVDVAADTEEPNVRSLSTKLVAGELDASLIYRTDALATGVEVIDVPGIADYRTTYWGTSLTGDSAVLDFLLSDTGQAILRSAGFAS